MSGSIKYKYLANCNLNLAFFRCLKTSKKFVDTEDAGQMLALQRNDQSPFSDATCRRRAATFALQVAFQEDASRAAPFSSGRRSFAVRMTNPISNSVFCNVTLPFKRNQRLLIEIINRNVFVITQPIVFYAVATSSFATVRVRRRCACLSIIYLSTIREYVTNRGKSNVIFLLHFSTFSLIVHYH